ncbi:MAG: DUF998 domain-containing protein [Candidatus Hodarchaeota archaeon]
MTQESIKSTMLNGRKFMCVDVILSSRSDHQAKGDKRLDLNDWQGHDSFKGMQPSKEILLRYLRKLILLPFMAFLGFILIGSLFFPNYSMLQNAISDLGNPIKNPNGWIFFGIALWILSSMHVPILYHLHKKLVKLDKWFSIIGTLFLATASFSMFLVVFFPNTPSYLDSHGLLTVLIFVGALFGVLFYWLVILKDAVFKTQSKSMRSITPFLSLAAGFIAVTLLMGTGTLIIAAPWYLGFAFWEWCFMFSFIVQLILLLKFRKSFYLTNAAHEGMNIAFSRLIPSDNKNRVDEK